jgi:hypothetical protein
MILLQDISLDFVINHKGECVKLNEVICQFENVTKDTPLHNVNEVVQDLIKDERFVYQHTLFTHVKVTYYYGCNGLRVDFLNYDDDSVGGEWNDFYHDDNIEFHYGL